MPMQLRHHFAHPVLFIDHGRFSDLHDDETVLQTVGIDDVCQALGHVFLMEMPP